MFTCNFEKFFRASLGSSSFHVQVAVFQPPEKTKSISVLDIIDIDDDVIEIIIVIFSVITVKN